MGFVCNLFIAGALSTPYNINSGVASPDRVCRGAALTTAAEGNIGTKVAFELTKNGITVDGRSGSAERLANNEAGNMKVRQILNDGSYMDREVSPQAVQTMRQQLKIDTVEP